MNQQEANAIQSLIDTLHRKLALARTCSAAHKGTNKKTQDALVLQINTLYKLCGVDYKID
jgi:hypothetical protein